MNEVTRPEEKLIATRLVRSPFGKIIAWNLYDRGQGRGRLEYMNIETGVKPLDSWCERIAILRKAVPCEGAVCLTSWIKA